MNTHSLLVPGAAVRTTNGTPRRGRVCRVESHRGAFRPMYFIEAQGKMITRRYLPGDLELERSDPQDDPPR